VARLVGGDAPALRVGVLDGEVSPISSVIFACWTSSQSSAGGALRQGPDERLVEEVLDHHR
jgi:hypothetical protein